MVDKPDLVGNYVTFKALGLKDGFVGLRGTFEPSGPDSFTVSCTKLLTIGNLGRRSSNLSTAVFRDLGCLFKNGSSFPLEFNSIFKGSFQG